MSAYLPKTIERLIQEFSRLPGIGPKTAERLTFHLLRSDEKKSGELGEALIKLREGVIFCQQCWNLSIENPCQVCRDVYRDRNLICVVEEPLDMIALEKTAQYKGLYHILHGAISPIDGIGPRHLKIAELLYRIKHTSVEELILATNFTLEGEATAQYIYNELKNTDFSDRPLKITRIAKGLPVGGNLEYSDQDTLRDALKGRKEF